MTRLLALAAYLWAASLQPVDRWCWMPMQAGHALPYFCEQSSSITWDVVDVVAVP